MIKVKRINRIKFIFDGMENLLDEIILEFKGGNLEYYDMPSKLYKLIRKQPYSAGRFIGYLKKGLLIPSFELMQEYVNKFNRDYIIINDKSEKLFLYGRDIFLSSIEVDKSTKDFAIVVNRRKEVLGLVKKQKRLWKNIVDRGLFLRKFD